MLEIENFNKIIVANWKLQGSLSFIKTYIKNIKFDSVEEQTKCVVICPPFPFINQINSKDLLIGSQDCSVYVEGAFTGETSTKMLKDIGCNFCIVGHSERRSLFGESNEMIAIKIVNCLEEQIIPILCIGENLEQKKQNKTKEILINQVQKSIPKQANENNMIIAYEPIWAIGTGFTPTLDEISEIHTFIKSNILQSKEFKILYGGSVKSSNCNEILTQENVDGVLVGSASIDIEEFNKIIESEYIS